MSLSKQKERENFLKNAILIVDHIKSSLTGLIELELKNKNLTFEQFLSQNQHDIYHLCFNNKRCCQCGPQIVLPKRRVLFLSQLDLLFDNTKHFHCHIPSCQPSECCHPPKVHISTDIIDITLARVLLFNFCTDVFWHSCLQFQSKSLEDFLNNNKHDIYHLWQFKTTCCQCSSGYAFPTNQQLISQTDWNQMYCCRLVACPNDRKRLSARPPSVCSASATTGINVQQLDKSLQNTLLRYCCKLHKTVENLVDIRNKRYGHVMEARMTDVDYSVSVQEINKALINIAHICGNEREVQQNLQDLQIRTLDETLVLQYQNNLLYHRDRMTDLKDDIEQVTVNLESLSSKFRKLDNGNREKMDVIEKNVEKISDDVKCLTISIEKEMKKDMSRREKAVHLTDMEIESHVNEKTFVKTSGLTSCVELLEKQDVHVLVLSGAAGTGKSRNGIEILRLFREKGYDVLKLTELENFEEVVAGNVSVKTLFLVEDIFGKTNNIFSRNTDFQNLDVVNLFVAKGNTKIIFTIRDIVKRSCERLLLSHRLFHKKVEVDLNTTDMKMSVSEKERLLFNYCNVNNFKIVGLQDLENFRKEEIIDVSVPVSISRATLHKIIQTEPLFGFPEACCLFTRNRKLTRLGEAFFKHTSKCLTEEVEDLRKSGKENYSNKMKYATLVYTLLNGDDLNTNNLNTHELKRIAMSCYNHNFDLKSFELEIVDAAEEMVDKYLTFKSDTRTYKFQHQTILESVLISYSRVNTPLILSKLSFDFTREMIRLETFHEQEGEIVLKIPAKYYSDLVQRIITILEIEFKDEPVSFIQKICDSSILRQNETKFINCLIDKSHQIMPLKNLNVIITYLDRCETVIFYLPAALLDHMIKFKYFEMSMHPLMDHVRFVLSTGQDITITKSCRTTLLAAFAFAVRLEPEESVFKCLLQTINDDTNSETKEYLISIVSSISTEKGMRLFLQNVRSNVLSSNAIVCELILRKWHNMFKLVEQCDRKLDTRELVKILCQKENNDSTKWLLQLMSDVSGGTCDKWNEDDREIATWFSTNYDLNKCSPNFILKEICLRRNMELMKWLHENDHANQYDWSKALISACNENNLEIGKWLLNNVNRPLLDLNMVLREVIHSEDEVIIKHIVEKIDHVVFDINILTETCRSGKKNIVLLLLQIANHFVLPELMDCALKACNAGNFEMVSWMINEARKKYFDMKTALNEASSAGDLEKVKWLIKNTTNSLIDTKQAMKNACYKGNLHIIMWLIENGNGKYELFDMITAFGNASDQQKLNIIQTLIENGNEKLFDLRETINKASRFNRTDIIKLLLLHFDHDRFDLKSALTLNCANTDIIAFLLEFVDISIFDMQAALNKSCKNGLLETVKLIVDTAFKENLSIDISSAMDSAVKHKQFKLVIWFILNVEQKFCNLSSLRSSKFKETEQHVLNFVLEYAGQCKFDKRTAIVVAIDRNDKNVAEWLIENYEYTATDLGVLFCEFCEIGDSGRLNLLLSNVEISLFDANTVRLGFVQACWKNKLDIVKVLLNYFDTSIFDTSIFQTALHGVCWENKLEMVGLLISKGVDFSHFEINQIMNEACARGSLDLVKLLFGTFDNTMLEMKTAMIWACAEGKVNIVEWLLDNVEHAQFNMATAINEACLNSQITVVKAFIDRIQNKSLDFEINLSSLSKSYSSFFLQELFRYIFEIAYKDLIDVRNLMIEACRFRDFNIAKVIIDNVDHNMLDFITAIKEFEHYDRKNMLYNLFLNSEEICYDLKSLHLQNENVLPHSNTEIDGRFSYCSDTLKYMLINVTHDHFNMPEIMQMACYNKCYDIVKWLIENVDHNLLDLNAALHILMNDAYYDGEYDMISYMLENVNHIYFNMTEIMNKVCADRNNFSHTKRMDLIWILLEKAFLLKRVDILKGLLGNIYFNWFVIKAAMNSAFTRRSIEIVKWLMVNVDYKLFDMKAQMNTACGGGKMEIKKWSISCDVKFLFAINTAMYTDFDWGNIDVVKWLLENVDNKLFDMKEAMNTACWRGNMEIMKWLLENIDNKLFDMKGAINTACWRGNWEIVKWLLENVDNKLFDMKEAMNKAYETKGPDGVTLLLENVDHRFLDLQVAVKLLLQDSDDHHFDSYLILWMLKNIDKEYINMSEVMNIACTQNDIRAVEWLMENVDHELLNLKTVIDKLMEDDDDDDDDDDGGGRTGVILYMFKNVNKEYFNMTKVMNIACTQNDIKVVQWLIENVDHELLNLKTVIDKLIEDYDDDDDDYDLDGRTSLILYLLKNVNKVYFNMTKVMNNACTHNRRSIIEWLIDNIDHVVLDVNTSIAKGLHSNNKLDSDIIELILQKVDHRFINFPKLMEDVCRVGQSRIVRWLLTNKDYSMFNMRHLMNEACYQCDVDLVEWIWNKFTKEEFDMKSAMNKSCRGKATNEFHRSLFKQKMALPMCQWLWSNVNHHEFDMETAMNNACSYGNTEIIEWMWKDLDHELFNMANALSNACRHRKYQTVIWIVENVDNNLLDIQTALLEVCSRRDSDYGNGLQIVQILLGHADRSTIDMYALIKSACITCNIDIIKRLVENSERNTIDMGHIMRLILDIDTNTSSSDKTQKTNEDSKKSLILWILYKADHALLDISLILVEICKNGWLDVLKWLWENVNHQLLNMKDTINIACQNGRQDVVSWSLREVDLTVMDTNTLMSESCGYGWIEIVSKILESVSSENLDVKSAMNEACFCGRKNIVTLLLEKNDFRMFDLTTLMNESCRHGWCDIVESLLENKDPSLFNTRSAVTEACSNGNIQIVEHMFSAFGRSHFDILEISKQICANPKCEAVAKFIWTNFRSDEYDLSNLVINACKHGWTVVVREILDNATKDTVDIKTAFFNSCVNGEIEIVKMLIDRYNHDDLDINTAFLSVCEHGWEEIATFVLDHVSHAYIDLKKSLNIACVKGEIDIAQLFVKKVDLYLLDFETATKEACKNLMNEELVLWILNKCDNNILDIEFIKRKSAENDWWKVSSHLLRISQRNVQEMSC